MLWEIDREDQLMVIGNVVVKLVFVETVWMKYHLMVCLWLKNDLQ